MQTEASSTNGTKPKGSDESEEDDMNTILESPQTRRVRGKKRTERWRKLNCGDVTSRIRGFSKKICETLEPGIRDSNHARGQSYQMAPGAYQLVFRSLRAKAILARIINLFTPSTGNSSIRIITRWGHFIRGCIIRGSVIPA